MTECGLFCGEEKIASLSRNFVCCWVSADEQPIYLSGLLEAVVSALRFPPLCLHCMILSPSVAGCTPTESSGSLVTKKRIDPVQGHLTGLVSSDQGVDCNSHADILHELSLEYCW